MIMNFLDKLGTVIFATMVILVLLSAFLPKPDEFKKLPIKKKLLLMMPIISKKNIVSDSVYSKMRKIILIDNISMILAITGFFLMVLQSMALKSDWYMNYLLGK